MSSARLLEMIPAAACTCDPQGLITAFNRHAVHLWGREPLLNDPADRFCGSFRLFSPDGTPIPHERSWMALALLEGREFDGEEILIERPDGERIAVLAHASPFCDDAGNVLGALNVLVDISDRRRAEDALREADRRRTDFLAMLAHELRNPLAPMRNALQFLMLKGSPDPELRWAREVIDRQLGHMTRLVDDLIDVARLASDRLELRRETVDLAEVVQAAVETSRPVIEERGHALEVVLPAHPAPVHADLTRLAQAISNLLDNAAKYTAPGGRICIAAEQQERETVVTVSDNGIGIAAEAVPRMFEVFSRGYRTAQWPNGGLGIGLPLARRLAEMHGGSLEARSDGVDRGSVFTLRLPASAPAPAALDAGGDGAGWNGSAGRLRILVVDDNRDSAATLDRLLRLLGHDTREAHDGAGALAAADEFRPQVILLDIGLPDMDGYAVARRIREQSWSGGIVLIAVTGWGLAGDRARSRDAGFDHHLVKPLDLRQLVALLASQPHGGSVPASAAIAS